MRSPELTLCRHNPIDSSVAVLDTEYIGSCGFIGHLVTDLACKNLTYLEKHYPEFTFSFAPGNRAPQPKPDYKAKIRGGWRVANWRTAPISDPTSSPTT